MKLLQILQKCLEDWKNISHLDFCLVNLDNTIYISTCDRALPSTEKLDEFKDEIDEAIIDKFKSIGRDTAKSVLELSAEELAKRTGIDAGTLQEVLNILKSEFE